MRTSAYGSHPQQVGDLHLPEGAGPHPVVVLWHGGSYSLEADRTMLTAASGDLAARGWAAWNVSYRRLESGGGWPRTFDDARAGLAQVAALDAPLDLQDVTALGFSAGLPLAHHATRRALADTAAAVRPRRLVNLAGVARLEALARIADGAGIRRLVGHPDDVPEAYAEADPARAPALGIPSLHLHGDADELVPVGVSRRHVDRVRAGGDEAELEVVPGAGHFDLHRPDGPGWAHVVAWLERTRGVPAGTPLN